MEWAWWFIVLPRSCLVYAQLDVRVVRMQRLSGLCGFAALVRCSQFWPPRLAVRRGQNMGSWLQRVRHRSHSWAAACGRAKGRGVCAAPSYAMALQCSRCTALQVSRKTIKVVQRVRGGAPAVGVHVVLCRARALPRAVEGWAPLIGLESRARFPRQPVTTWHSWGAPQSEEHQHV